MNYLPGTASLVEEIDKKLLVVLRDGRTLIGYLRSIDQFGWESIPGHPDLLNSQCKNALRMMTWWNFSTSNLVLHKTIERIHVGQKYGDLPRGIFVIRGENVVLLGEIDAEKEENTPLTQVSIDEILELQQEEQLAQQQKQDLKKRAMKERGLVCHTDPIHDDFF